LKKWDRTALTGFECCSAKRPADRADDVFDSTDRSCSMNRLTPKTIRRIGRLHAWIWRLSGGRFGDGFGRAPFLLLTTKGRKTQRPRTTPVLYLEDGNDLIVVGSFGGNDQPPSWLLNLISCPEAEILLKGKRSRRIARAVASQEKQRLWPRLVSLYPNFAVYQQRTDRDIPLIRLSEPK
jgi:deazaflavin-dependent oxidoreductase (nitroreductase family)